MKAKKTTMATVKAFIRKNSENLFVKVESSFDGMTDCVEKVEDDFRKVNTEEVFNTRVGVFISDTTKNYIKPFENENFKGFSISNCCGRGIVATTKL